MEWSVVTAVLVGPAAAAAVRVTAGILWRHVFISSSAVIPSTVIAASVITVAIIARRSISIYATRAVVIPIAPSIAPVLITIRIARASAIIIIAAISAASVAIAIAIAAAAAAEVI